MKSPRLYIQDRTGKRRFWEIELKKSVKEKSYLLSITYGIVGGKITKPIPRKLSDLKKATTKMNALIKKKREEGFRQEDEEIVSKKTHFGPMGAQKLDDFAHKLAFPVLVQHKLDGFRCLAHFDEECRVSLFSKNMKPFTHLYEIKRELESLSLRNTYLDGELYNHDLELRHISSLVMKKKPLSLDEKEDEKKIRYHLFDIVLPERPFEERYQSLSKLLSKKRFQYLHLVKAVAASNLEEVYALNDQYLLEGYEGVIVRNRGGLYEYKKKSYDVLRTKEFKHGNFEIIGGKEGSGSHTGTVVWKLKCSGGSFFAIQMGTLTERKAIFQAFRRNPGNFIGKRAKVKYLSIDSNGCVLRNPIVEMII